MNKIYLAKDLLDKVTIKKNTIEKHDYKIYIIYLKLDECTTFAIQNGKYPVLMTEDYAIFTLSTKPNMNMISVGNEKITCFIDGSICIEYFEDGSSILIYKSIDPIDEHVFIPIFDEFDIVQ